MRVSSSIRTAQLLTHLAPVLAVTAVLALSVFDTARESLEAEVGHRLEDIARIAGQSVPFERLNLIEPGGEQTRMVRRLNAKLAAVRTSAGVGAIEVCRAAGTVLIGASPDSKIGSPCLRTPTPDARARLARGETGFTGSFRRGDTRYIAAFAPVTEPDGRLFAYVVVRAGAGEVDVAVQLQTRLLIAAGLTVLLGTLLSMLLAGWIARPIQQVATAANQIGGGRYSARVEPPAIRELARLAHAINTMAEQVERRDRKLKAMAGTVAHEVRNPLNSIKLLLTLLDEELAAAGHHDQHHIVSTVHDEIGRLDRVLTGFLTWSRPVALADEPTDARVPVAKAVQMARAAAAEADVTLRLMDGPPIAVRLDAQRMEQSVLNLVLNAVQASSLGEVVEVEVIEMNEQVEIAVRDRGAGLTPEVRARLFEPFFTTRATGTGLGLANARAIVQAHGGRLDLEDRAGGGTCARVRLPKETG